MARMIDQAEKVLRFVYSDPKHEVVMGGPSMFSTMFGGDEPINADWYEPRYDAPWRRDNARHIEWFGSEKFGEPSAPVEGPNNPNRLRRELTEAETSLVYAESEQEDADDHALTAEARISKLQERLAATER